MEVNKNGRRKEEQCMGMGYWNISSGSCRSIAHYGRKLIRWLFFIFYFGDTALSSIGLVKGLWAHYNPLGVWIYNYSTIFGFIIYRILLFYIIYKIINLNIIRLKTLLVFIGAYIYSCAILWDLHTFGFINLYDVIPWPVLNFHFFILRIVFRVFGII